MAFTEEYEPFALIGTATAGPHQTYDDYKQSYGNSLPDTDIQLASALRSQYPGHTLTVVPVLNCDLIGFAGAGYAIADLDTKSESAVRWRGYFEPSRRGGEGQVGDAIRFAKYHYKWLSERFIVYVALVHPYNSPYPVMVYYILRELEGGETESSRSTVTDKLIKAVGEWQFNDAQIIWVYDFQWLRDRRLWEEVQKAKWADIILGEDVYRDLGVPWKRGVIFHGPPGNGKTITLKAIMHTLSVRKAPIPTLYVKAAPYTWHIQAIFQKARQIAPCLLVLEDIDTIVTEVTRSYFFNEADGLGSNDGILMVASTNHLERLDPGLSHRPSRFDRKYLFPPPNLSERTLYCNYWRHKIQSRSDREGATCGGGKPRIDFPEKLCPAMAAKMDRFSFAYMKEAFVATLLTMAERTGDDDEEDKVREEKDGETKGLEGSEGREMEDNDGDDLDKYEIWRVFVEQVKILREDVDNGTQTLKLEPTVPRRTDANVSNDFHERRKLSRRYHARGGMGAGLGGLPVHEYRLEAEMSADVGLVPGENCILSRS